jgi:hypothetical protein
MKTCCSKTSHFPKEYSLPRLLGDWVEWVEWVDPEDSIWRARNYLISSTPFTYRKQSRYRRLMAHLLQKYLVSSILGDRDIFDRGEDAEHYEDSQLANDIGAARE